MKRKAREEARSTLRAQDWAHWNSTPWTRRIEHRAGLTVPRALSDDLRPAAPSGPRFDQELDFHDDDR